MLFTADEIARTVAAVDICEMFGPDAEFEMAGAQPVGICPFCDERSLSVEPADGLWHCFGCSREGDAIRLVELRQGVSWEKAIRLLAAAHGVSVGAGDG